MRISSRERQLKSGQIVKMSSHSHRSRAERLVRFGALGFVMLFSIVSLNWDSPYVRPYSHGIIGFVGCAGIAIVLVRLSAWRTWTTHGVERVSSMSPLTRRLVYAWGFIAPLLLALVVLDPIPHIPDGYAYLFQAKLFTLGRLWAPSPEFPAFFPAPWSVDLDGRLFTVFPPGWPMVLALGVAAGLPYFVNPVLGALSLLVMWHLWQELFDEQRANLALALCALSPFYLFMSAGFMSHNVSLLTSSLFALAFLKSIRTDSLAWGCVAGFAIGFQILVRPVSALFIFAAVAGFFALSRRSVTSWKTTAYSLIGAGLGTAAYGIYNRALVGEWGVPPLYFLTPANQFGFGTDIGLPWATSFPTPGHDPLRALLNLNLNMSVMNNDLFGWPLASLLFVAICLLIKRLQWQHRLSATIAAAAVVLYAGYWYNGVAFGARFYYCLLPYLVILSVEGIRATPGIIRSTINQVDADHSRAFASTLVLGFVLYGTFAYAPRVALTSPYWNQRKISFEFYEELDALVEPGDLVFVETDSEERYNPAFIKNAIKIEQSPVIYARDLGDAENAQLIDRFPERRIVRWRYPIERLNERTPLARLRARLETMRSGAR
jgi:hypothetical protein